MEEGDESRQEVEAGPAVTETAQPATSPRRREPYRLLCWGVGASVVALARNRVWGTPNLAFFTAISTSLGRNPFTGGRGGLNGDYLMTNLLGPVVARGLGQTAPHAYARLHLVVLVAGVVAVLIATYRRFGFTAARALCVLLALAPVTTVACEWLGQPDAFTLPLALGLVVARRWPARFGLAVLLGLSHGEQGVGIALVAAAVSLVVDGVDPHIDRATAAAWLRALLAPLGGVVAGRAIVEIYFRLNDITIMTPRTSFLDLGTLADEHGRSHWLVYALLGPLWALAVAAVVRCVQLRRAGIHRELVGRWAVLGVALAAALVPMLLTLDETRVFGLVSAPVLVGAAVLIPQTSWWRWAASARTLGVAAVVVLAVPAVFTAGGSYPSWSIPGWEFAGFMYSGEHPGTDLTTWLLEPFGFEVPNDD